MKIIQYFRSSFLFRQAMILLSGTGLAQLITIGMAPILARIYTPDDFGLFATFTALVFIGSVFANGRYEFAVMLPKKDSDAFAIGQAGIIFSIIICIILYVLLLKNKLHIERILGIQKNTIWIYLAPITIFSLSINNILIYWHNRKQFYKFIAAGKIIQSSSTGITQSLLSSLGFGGLLLGYFAGLFISSSYLIIKAIKKASVPFTNYRSLNNNSRKIIKNARKYIKFPLFSTWGALLDATASHLPLIMITYYYNTYYSGVFSMAIKTVNMPLVLLSSALSQILLQKIVALDDANQPDKLKFFIKRTLINIWICILPFGILIFLFGSEIFSLFLGDKWSYAGKIAMVMTPALLFRFSVGAISGILLLNRNILSGVLWQVSYFITLAITLWYAKYCEFEKFIYIISIHEIILYSIYLYLILSNIHPKKIGK